jgi:ADP-heptose:LPS heptosyltransferase
VLIARTDRLGETVLLLPALQALREAWPQARIGLCVQAALQPLMALSPHVSEVFAAPPLTGAWWRDAWRLAEAWRPWAPEAVVVANPSKAAHVAAWRSGARRRVGFDRKWSGLLTHRVPDRKAVGGAHEVAYNQALFEVLGRPLAAARPARLRVDAAAERELAEILAARLPDPSVELIAVHPWTSHPKKQWPLPNVHALIRRLRAAGRRAITIIGGPQERAHAEAWPEAGTGVADLTGALSLTQLAALLRRCRALISNDSGPVHVAAAVGTPVVALFGTTDPAAGPGRWGPFGEGHAVIHQPTMQAITVEQVLEAAQRVLARASAAEPGRA